MVPHETQVHRTHTNRNDKGVRKMSRKSVRFLGTYVYRLFQSRAPKKVNEGRCFQGRLLHLKPSTSAKSVERRCTNVVLFSSDSTAVLVFSTPICLPAGERVRHAGFAATSPEGSGIGTLCTSSMGGSQPEGTTVRVQIQKHAIDQNHAIDSPANFARWKPRFATRALPHRSKTSAKCVVTCAIPTSAKASKQQR